MTAYYNWQVTMQIQT